MSSRSSPTLIIDVRARRAEGVIVVCTLAVAVLSPWLLTSLAPPAALSAGIVAFSGLAIGFRRAGWLGGLRSLETLSWISDGRWVLVDRAGAHIEATLGAGTRVGPGLVWLRWRVSNSGFPLVRTLLLTDRDLPAQTLRRLVVRLRIDGLGRGGRPVIVVA
jgi:hypothetical protein